MTPKKTKAPARKAKATTKKPAAKPAPKKAPAKAAPKKPAPKPAAKKTRARKAKPQAVQVPAMPLPPGQDPESAAAAAVTDTEAPLRLKSGRGRPRVCIGPVWRAIIVSAYTGLHRSDIAADVGISEQSLRRFVKEAKAGHRKVERRGSGAAVKLTEWDLELWRFWQAFRRAELEAKKGLVRTVMSATEPKDALNVLGRRWRNWAPVKLLANAPDEDEDGQPTGKPGTLNVAAPVDDETRKLLAEELAKRGLPTAILTGV